MAILMVVAVAGLIAWAVIGSLVSANTSTWESASVPSGQPYNLAPAKPVIPKGSKLTAAQLPPMVESAPHSAVTLTVDPPPLGGNYGTDGQVHDVFSPAFFSVPAGKTIDVTVYNYDMMWHTFTSTALGLNVWIPPGGEHPTKVSFSFKAPSSGNYYWLCAIPCDSYSMTTPGYMEGEVHVVPK